MRVKILPYRRGSQSATALRVAINRLYEDEADMARVGMLRAEGTTFMSREGDVVINWGNGNHVDTLENAYIINPPNDVATAIDKVATLERLSEVCNVPEYTMIQSVANEWLADNSVVLARTLTRANGGRGIVVVEPGDQLPAAPLYVKYINKVHEYRVHVLGEDVHVRQKRRRLANDNPNWRIRSHDNGFVFAQAISYLPNDLIATALRAIGRLRLDFGAVDIIYNSYQDTCYVLEVNTAPGLAGTTLNLYANYFKGIIDHEY